MMKLALAAAAALLTAGCAVAKVAGTAVSVGATAAKTTAKVGGAVVDGAVDVVDDDRKSEEPAKDENDPR